MCFTVKCFEWSKVSKMEKIIEHGILYDFYGPLLTEHQQEVYEMAVYENLSLSEIADEKGISRQGVHDLIKRCGKTLEEYEEKLHLVKRFSDNRKKLLEIKQMLPEGNKDLGNSLDQIIEEL